jgi:hypothetical protein
MISTGAVLGGRCSLSSFGAWSTRGESTQEAAREIDNLLRPLTGMRFSEVWRIAFHGSRKGCFRASEGRRLPGRASVSGRGAELAPMESAA